MNSLRVNNQQGILQSQDFKNFVAMTSPAKAQAQIQNMLQSGQLSQQDFERAKLIAQSLIGK